MAHYEIWEANMEALESKLNKIAKKCAAYGCDFHYEKGEPYYRTMEDEFKNKFVVKFFPVDVSGTAVIDGWEFVAQIEHTENGNVIRGEDVPAKYFSCKPYCEHCNKVRARSTTYLIRNANGEIKQVGKSCLKDYTGCLDSEMAAAWYNGYSVCEDAERYDVGDMIHRCKPYYDTEKVMTYFVRSVELFGFVPASNWYEGSTAEVGVLMYNFHNGHLGMVNEKRAVEYEDQNFTEDSVLECEETARKILEWMRGLDADSSYQNNLKTIAGMQYVEHKHMAFLASGVRAYENEIEKVQKEEARKEQNNKDAASSGWVGEVGKRIKVAVAEAKLLTSWETQFGITLLYQFKDADGNVFIWKASSGIDTDVSFVLVGTVKEHSEYNGVKQTVLTRCRTDEIKNGKAA